MSSDNKLSRRKLLHAAVIVAPVTLTGCASAGRDLDSGLSSENEPLLKTTDPVARALAYYSDTRNVVAADPLATNHEVKQKCSNCIHNRGSAGPDRLECPMFPGRSVSTDGWCSLWAQGEQG